MTRLHRIFLIKPQHEGGGVSKSSHIELAAVFFSKVHSINMELVQFLKLGANRQIVKGRISSILVKLEQLGEEAVGKEVVLQ